MNPSHPRVASLCLAALLVVSAAQSASARRTQLKPGFNLFSPEQDIQLGREAAAEAEKQVALLRDPRVDDYLNRLGKRLAAQAPGHNFPYQFKAVNDSTLNAFALPGGFLYVNRGTIEAADNEAQLAGVMGHEIAHVALRHGTNQVSRALLVRFPLALAGGLLGGSGSVLGQLSALGLDVVASGVLLKYSRSAETQADLMGTQILYDVGLEPKELAAFFQKMERGGGTIEFFSSHPSPPNRVRQIEAEIGQLGPKSGLRRDSEEFQAIRSYLKSLPPAPKPGERGAAGTARAPARPAPPSSRFRTYEASDFSLAFPDNWKVHAEGTGVVLAPEGGVLAAEGGAAAIAYGVIANRLEEDASLEEATDRLLHSMRQSNPELRERSRQRARVAGERGLFIELRGRSPLPNEVEIVWLLAAQPRRGPFFYLICVAPETEFGAYQRTFERVADSVRLR